MWFLVTHTGRRIPISALPADIGSDASSDVHLPDPSVAPLHARLLPGAATGLRLEVFDGALVEVDGWALTEADLRAGDELLVGTVTVRLETDDPGLPKPPAASTTSGASRPPRRPLDRPAADSLSSPRSTRRTLPAPRPPRSLAPGSGGRPGRRGLLNADLGQLSFGTRCILGLALLLLAAAIVWAVAALVVSLA